MNKKYIIIDMKDALSKKAFPEVTVWNRLEGRPRTHNLDRALKAEIRDALWMLTRQYQMGEFFGDDAASPVFAKLHVTKSHLTHYLPEAHSWQSFEENVPLEAHVERRPIPFRHYQRIIENEQTKLIEQNISLEIRLLMGRQWLKHLRTAGFGDYSKAFIDSKKYAIVSPDPEDPNDAYLCAHPEVWATFAAVAGRCVDGGKLYLYLKENFSHRASDDIELSDPAHKVPIDELGQKFMKWFERLYYQPPDENQDAWLPDRLEYQFAVSAPQGNGQIVLRSEEYYQGRLDWFNFDRVPSATGPDVVNISSTLPPEGMVTQTLIPTQVVFEGMPNTRWWAFEDRRTNFGDIRPETTDIAKLLLMEFGLIYANDWFLIPLRLKTWMPATNPPDGDPQPANNHISASVFNVKGMVVTNVFGERFWIKSAGSNQADTWQRWSMFTIDNKGDLNIPIDTSLLLLPTALKIQEGKSREQAVFIRDELANMVWGIEKIVPLANGDSKRGSEAAIELHEYLGRLLHEKMIQMKARKDELENKAENNRTQEENDELAEIIAYLQNILPPLPSPKADIRYQVMNTVPEHWIPFIPVHVKNDNREIQLQRAAMPRILEGGPKKAQKIRPCTLLLREGLDKQLPTAYYVHEEEIPRAGIQISQSFQRARWRDGSVWVWLGVKKQIGRGEGSSRLAFDQIISVEKPKQ